MPVGPGRSAGALTSSTYAAPGVPTALVHLHHKSEKRFLTGCKQLGSACSAALACVEANKV
eukprot:365366-Chlamydomonas_euryale.AAC.19